MRALRIATLGLGLAVAACDEEPAVISHVGQRGDIGADDLWTMQGPRGIPVEIHGSPFRNVSDRALADALRVPGRSAQDVAFHAAPPGGQAGARLVLHFNPQGAPNSVTDCRRREEARTNPPRADGFAVNATFCTGEDWLAHGYMQVPAPRDRDVAAFSDAMGQLFAAMFDAPADR